LSTILDTVDDILPGLDAAIPELLVHPSGDAPQAEVAGQPHVDTTTSSTST